MHNLTEMSALNWGQHCFILGNGPSLDLVTEAQWDLIGTSIGLNRSFYKTTSTYYCIVRNVQFLRDILESKWNYKCSTIFYLGLRAYMFAGMPKEAIFACGGKVDTSNFIFVEPTENVSSNLEEGHKVSNTGEFAIYVALWLGFRYIYLLGYDCNGVEGHFKNGIKKGQWEQDRIADHTADAAHYNEVLALQINAANTYGAEIYNCNKASAIKVWPYISVDQALDWQERI